jgi:PIN domain nuclease of toxin-antitoxin system
MSDLVTDTHPLIWYLEDSTRLSYNANQAFERCDRGEVVIY